MRPCKNGSIDIALSRQIVGNVPRGFSSFVTIGDRHPRVALLLLEHLYKNTSGKMQSNIGETKKFVLEQTRGVE